jgi:DNA-binding GntR family transcriptional regulator
MLMDQQDPFTAALETSATARAERRARLLPRLQPLIADIGTADYRTPDQRRRVARVLLITVLLATPEMGDPDFADLAHALQRGQAAGGNTPERGHAARDLVGTLLTAARLPAADVLLRQLGQALFMSADDRTQAEWAQVLRNAGRLVDALETAQPRRALSATTALLRTAGQRLA